MSSKYKAGDKIYVGTHDIVVFVVNVSLTGVYIMITVDAMDRPIKTFSESNDSIECIDISWLDNKKNIIKVESEVDIETARMLYGGASKASEESK